MESYAGAGRVRLSISQASKCFGSSSAGADADYLYCKMYAFLANNSQISTTYEFYYGCGMRRPASLTDRGPVTVTSVTEGDGSALFLLEAERLESQRFAVL